MFYLPLDFPLPLLLDEPSAGKSSSSYLNEGLEVDGAGRVEVDGVGRVELVCTRTCGGRSDSLPDCSFETQVPSSSRLKPSSSFTQSAGCHPLPFKLYGRRCKGRPLELLA